MTLILETLEIYVYDYDDCNTILMLSFVSAIKNVFIYGNSSVETCRF